MCVCVHVYALKPENLHNIHSALLRLCIYSVHVLRMCVHVCLCGYMNVCECVCERECVCVCSCVCITT